MLFTAPSAWAVIARPGSGLVGDEWFSYNENDPIAHNPQALMQRRMAAEQIRPRQKMSSTFPKFGKVRSIAILVNFTDVQFTIPNAKEAFYAMLNESGYSDNKGTGSARDYFIASSDSLFLPEFDVVGPYTLAHEQAYYGAHTGGSSFNHEHVMEMIRQACALAEADGVDFRNYDENNDGQIDNVFVYYAGYNEADGGGSNTVWPHRSVVYPTSTFNGKELFDYACSSELKTTSGRLRGEMTGIGAFCHEFGHVLGLPDMYNTASSNVYTVGTWDIMCSGSYSNDSRTPPMYTAFERYMLGWAIPTQLTNAGDYLLEPLEDGGEAYLIATKNHNLTPGNPNPAEFWLVENRQHVGWDTPEGALPGTGLLISHITHKSANWNSNTYNNSVPLGFDVCEAYNPSPTYSTESDTYPGAMNITSFLPQANNGTKLSHMQVSKIRLTGEGLVAFHFGTADSVGLYVFPEEIPAILAEIVDGERTGGSIEKIEISGKKLLDSILYISLSPNTFQMSWDSVTWYRNQITDAIAADSTYQRALYVRYSPTKSCVSQSGSLQIETGNYKQSTQAVLQGEATRPILITPVIPQPADDITPYSFLAQWEEQDDADIYYLTLFRLLDKEQEIVQSFDRFDSQAHIRDAGWKANFVNLTTVTHSEGKAAVLFEETGDTLVSETFVMPVTKMSVWTGQSFVGTMDTDNGGSITIEGFGNDNQWHTIEVITMRSTSKAQTRTYTFDEQDSIRIFRFSYNHIGGLGGIAVDDFHAVMNKTPEYIYSGTDYILYAPVGETTLDALKPATDYYYQLQAYEDKGCEPHMTDLGPIMHVTTRQGTAKTGKQFTIHCYNSQKVYAYLPDWTSTDYRLYVYDTAGRLVKTVPILESGHTVQIPTEGFVPNTLYLVKYAPDSGIQRKNLWSKFLYR